MERRADVGIGVGWDRQARGGGLWEVERGLVRRGEPQRRCGAGESTVTAAAVAATTECIAGRISLLALVWLMPLLVGQALEGAAQGWHLYSIPGQFMSKRCASM